jgi:hypothetical protein
MAANKNRHTWTMRWLMGMGRFLPHYDFCADQSEFAAAAMPP